MMMTAAGTIPAAKVLVVGAGVAGLQAIATAKRMGAIVFAIRNWNLALDTIPISQLKTYLYKKQSHFSECQGFTFCQNDFVTFYLSF